MTYRSSTPQVERLRDCTRTLSGHGWTALLGKQPVKKRAAIMLCIYGFTVRRQCHLILGPWCTTPSFRLAASNGYEHSVKAVMPISTSVRIFTAESVDSITATILYNLSHKVYCDSLATIKQNRLHRMRLLGTRPACTGWISGVKFAVTTYIRWFRCCRQLF